MKLSYKGYATRLERDPDTAVWHGRVNNIQDVVTFEGATEVAAELEFRQSVDAYLHFCRAIDRVPNQPEPPDSPVFGYSLPPSARSTASNLLNLDWQVLPE